MSDCVRIWQFTDVWSLGSQELKAQDLGCDFLGFGV